MSTCDSLNAAHFWFLSVFLLAVRQYKERPGQVEDPWLRCVDLN